MMSTITGCLQEGVIERMKYTLDYQKYAELARRVAAEGSVLLRNEEDTLPLRRGQRVSVFGRTQFEHYKSGTGSGGMVNAPYVTNIIDSLKEMLRSLSCLRKSVPSQNLPALQIRLFPYPPAHFSTAGRIRSYQIIHRVRR